MSRCGFCDSLISRKPSVSCSGPCKKPYHAACIKLPGDFIYLLTTVQGLSWKCSCCATLQPGLTEDKLHALFEKMCTNLFCDFSNKFESLKAEIMEQVLKKISEVTATQIQHPSVTPTFADKVREGPQPKIVVRPKNPNQEYLRTKSDILQNINPVDSNIKINKVKHIKNGGILLNCNNAQEANKFKKLAEEKLATSYDIHELKSVHPVIRIVGMTEQLSNETLLDYILKQNSGLFNSDCNNYKVIRIWQTKKNNNIYQATLQVDIATYTRVIEHGRVLIGLDSCTVYEAPYVPRCYTCNNYFHTKNTCKNAVSCPVCSQAHKLDNCPKDSHYSCSNCCYIKGKLNVNINTDHPVWDYSNCFAYKKAIEKVKADLLGTPT